MRVPRAQWVNAGADRAQAVPAEAASHQIPGIRVSRFIIQTNSFLGSIRAGGGGPPSHAAGLALLGPGDLATYGRAALSAPQFHVPEAPGA